MEDQGYEFSEAQNEVILNLSKKMNFLGMILVIIAFVYFATAVYPLTKSGTPTGFIIGTVISHIIAGALYVAIGLFTIKASKSFRLIVQTQGSDIKNLMDALAFLLKQYSVQYWVVILALIFLGIAFIAILLIKGIPAL